MRKSYSRPESIQETTETERGYQHEDSKLRDHGTEREDHEVVFERHEGKPASNSTACHPLRRK
jgi:hypothetical protein